MPSNGTIVDASSSPPLERECVQLHKGDEESEENTNLDEKQDNGASIKKAGRPGRKRKHLPLESFDSPKDHASVQKCHFSLDSRSCEPLHNGDLEPAAAQRKLVRPVLEEDGSGTELNLKEKRHFQEDSDSFQDGDIGQLLENGCCTPTDIQDWQEDDEGEMEQAIPRKKRGRRRLSDMTDKSKEEKEEQSCDSSDPEGCRGRLRRGLGWEISLRQRPLQRHTFQAGDPYYVSKRKRDEWLARWKREDVHAMLASSANEVVPPRQGLFTPSIS